MENPDELVDAIRDALRDIPGVVALVGGDATLITAYENDQPSIFDALNETPEPSLLVVLEQGEFTQEENAQYQYIVKIYMRLGGQRLGGAFFTICSGIRAGGDGQPFSGSDIHSGFEQIGLPTFVRDTDQDGIEYPAVAMTWRDKSNG